MKQITSIPKHSKEEVFPSIIRSAIADGLRCEPADRKVAEESIRTIYRCSGLNGDVPVVWVPSPIVGALAAPLAALAIGGSRKAAVDSAVYSAVDSAVYSAVDSAVYSAVYSAVNSAVNSAVYSAVDSAVYYAVDSAVDSAVYSAVYSAVNSAVYSAVDSAVYSKLFWHDWRGGQMWIAWSAFVEAIMALGVEHPSFVAIRAERQLCASAGYYWPNKNFIMVCERPSAIRRDDAGRLHCATGPAVDYGDTFKLYSWHGISVPASWFEKAKPTPSEALKLANVEQRRAACEMLGWHRILAELNAKTINKHDNPQVGELVEVAIPGSGKERFLRVLCGTGREFALPVPRNMKTAIEAQAWTWGLDAKTFTTPEVRT